MRVVDADKLAKRLREIEEIHINNDLWYKILDCINELSEEDYTGKTKCSHPNKCHECNKILTCDYYKK